MRIFIAALFAIFVAVALASCSSFVFGQSAKSICVPIKFNESTVDPNKIPDSYLDNMTLVRGNTGASYGIGISLCQTHTLKACGDVPGYVAIVTNGTCVGAFNEVKSRPTTSTGD